MNKERKLKRIIFLISLLITTAIFLYLFYDFPLKTYPLNIESLNQEKTQASLSSIDNLDSADNAFDSDSGNLDSNNDPEQNLLTNNNSIIKLEKNIPESIINSSDSFVKSFVDSEDIENNDFKFQNAFAIYDANGEIESYLVVYSLDIEYTRENGKKIRSTYPIKVEVDKNGVITDKSAPKKKYEGLKNGGATK